MRRFLSQLSRLAAHRARCRTLPGHAMRPHVMANVSIARRYAKALVEVASETNTLDAVTQQLDMLAAAFEQNPELQALAINPAYTRSVRSAVVEQVLKSGNVTSAALMNLMKLLVDRNRLIHLTNIARLFRDM